MIYNAVFTRTNYGGGNKGELEETVCVVFESRKKIGLWDIAWRELMKQYPIWECPYSQSKPPPNKKESVRHGFSSAWLAEIYEIHGKGNKIKAVSIDMWNEGRYRQ